MDGMELMMVKERSGHSRSSITSLLGLLGQFLIIESPFFELLARLL